MSYHLTQTDVKLLSTQTYHHIHVGYYGVYGFRVRIYFNDHIIHIPTDIEQKNPHIVKNSFMLENEKLLIGP